MLIDRRTFIQGAALLAAGDLLSLTSHAPARALAIPDFLSNQTAHGEMGKQYVFKIDGWDRRDDVPAGQSESSPSGPLPDEDLAGDEVFIRINQGWRTSWR